MKFASLILVALLSACAAPPAQHNDNMREMRLSVAGGETVTLDMSKGIPPPAENEHIKINMAGFVTKRAELPGEVATLIWTFGFRQKSGPRIESVTVEDVTSVDGAVLMLADTAPQPSNMQWSGRARPIVLTQESTPWMYSDAPSMFVFKFTIKLEGMPSQVLYQGSRFPAAAKKLMVAV